jgi:hypothetical protein
VLPPTIALMRRFHFASARWFRLPMKAVVIAVAVFALLSVYPSLTGDVPAEQRRALAGLLVLFGFVALGVTFSALIDDGAIELAADVLHVRFESFVRIDVPLASIVAVRAIDPQPRWRYRFGLATDWEARLSCSHGGQLVELELAEPLRIRLWPRAVEVSKLWLGVREHGDFIAAIERELAQSVRRAA